MSAYSEKTIVPILNSDSNGLITVSSSSIYSNTYKNYMAFDGVTGGTNAWVSMNNNVIGEWLKVDLGEVKQVGKYAITAWGSSSAGIPKSFKLQGSFDNVVWADLDVRTNLNLVVNQRLEFENNIKSDKYRYYRLLFQEVQSSTYVSVGEFELFELNINSLLLKSNNKVYSLKSEEILYETKMTSNTAPAPYVASASGQSSTTNSPWKAFNGTNLNISDCWIVSAQKGWIQIDFGSKKLANVIYVANRNNTSDFATSPPKDFNILGSNDGFNFDTIAEIKNQTSWTQDQTRRFTINKPKEYRYYRLEILTNNGDAYTAVGEILYTLEQGFTELPSSSEQNFINYGANLVNDFNLINTNKNYVLSTIDSSGEDGLLRTQINRKPLSIKFN